MSPETHHIAGDTNDYHDTVNNGDQYFGEVQAEVVGGKGHNNSFYGRNQTGDNLLYTPPYQLNIDPIYRPAGLASPSVQDTQGDELLEAQIALTRARHDNKRLVAELAAAKAQLDSARAELAVYKQ